MSMGLVYAWKDPKLNRLKSTYLEGYFENERRKSIVEVIELDIFMDFYRNLEHKEKYIESIVEYKGQRTYVRFYDMRQVREALHFLSNYFYMRGGKNES